HSNGRLNVLHAEAQPSTTRPYASQNHAVVTRGIYVLLSLVPRRTSSLLGVQ
ncbi:MAG: hypothetical protein RLZZ602_2367, partial [Pseudomonadota bacterium]